MATGIMLIRYFIFMFDVQTLVVLLKFENITFPVFLAHQHHFAKTAFKKAIDGIVFKKFKR